MPLYLLGLKRQVVAVTALLADLNQCWDGEFWRVW